MLQTVLDVGQAIGQHTTRQHGAQDFAGRVDLILLEPAQIKHRVMGDPSAFNREKFFNIYPSVVVKIKTINNYRCLTVGA